MSCHFCKPDPTSHACGSPWLQCVTNSSGLPGWECLGSLWQRRPRAGWPDSGGWDPSAPAASYVWTKPARMRRSQPQKETTPATCTVEPCVQRSHSVSFPQVKHWRLENRKIITAGAVPLPVLISTKRSTAIDPLIVLINGLSLRETTGLTSPIRSL